MKKTSTRKHNDWQKQDANQKRNRFADLDKLDEAVGKTQKRGIFKTCWYCGTRLKKGEDETMELYRSRHYCDDECERDAYLEINTKAKAKGATTEALTPPKTLQPRGLTKNGEPLTMEEQERLPVSQPRTALGIIPNNPGAVQKLAQAYTVEAINALVDIVRKGRDKDKISAAQLLLDRGWGKAGQQVELKLPNIRDMSEHELMQLLGIKDPSVIEGEILD